MTALRGFGKPYPKQAEAFKRILTIDDPDRVKQIDICAGRGWGKTMFAIAAALKAMCDYPGITGKFLEPDWKRIREAFLPKWYKMVPREIYTINKGDNCITLINGSNLFYGARNVTGNRGLADDGGRGPDVSFIIDDEAAIGCSNQMYLNNLPAIREAGCPNRFYLTISTFQYGDYELMLDSPGHEVIYGRTADNIYLPKGMEAQLRASMPPEVAERELDSKRGMPEGRIWTQFNPAAWPDGNILEGYEFDPARPWWLGVDMGNHGAWHVLQCPPARHPLTGGTVMAGSLLCVVEEYVVNNDGNPKTGQGGFEGVLSMIVDKYCGGDPRKNKPQCVFVGHDVNTPGQMRGESGVQILGNLGWNYMFPAGVIAGKDIQRSHLQRMLWERRYVVAATIDSSGRWQTKKVFDSPRKKRGILEMFLRDTHPDEKGRVFDKDKAHANPMTSIEDDRDCALYEAVLWKHPDEYDVANFYRQVN